VRRIDCFLSILTFLLEFVLENLTSEEEVATAGDLLTMIVISLIVSARFSSDFFTMDWLLVVIMLKNGPKLVSAFLGCSFVSRLSGCFREGCDKQQLSICALFAVATKKA